MINKNLRLDMNNLNHGLIITGMLRMVEEEGLTPHEVFEVMEDIKRQTWHALSEIQSERKVSHD